MNRRLIVALVLGTALVLFTQAFVLMGGGASAPPSAVSIAEHESDPIVAGPGRVEPVTEEIDVAAEIGGLLRAVSVAEGESIRRGQIIARLDDDDARARVAAAEAELAQQEARLRRTINGAREQERAEARAVVARAEAVVENARGEAERRRDLLARGVIAREEAERSERAYRVALAERETARQQLALVEDDAREEDRAEGEASVALARARLADARSQLEKTIVRSPIDGVVLKKHLHAGETVSDQMPRPIVTVGDTAVLRIRVDVDETDVSRIAVGQRAFVTAPAFGERRFAGRVVQLGPSLGRKTVRTDEPIERVDTKILEVLVELEPGERLPIGLRVDAFIAVGASSTAELRPAPQARSGGR